MLYKSSTFFVFFVELAGVEPASSLFFSMSHSQLSLIYTYESKSTKHSDICSDCQLVTLILYHVSFQFNLFYDRVLNNSVTLSVSVSWLVIVDHYWFNTNWHIGLSQMPINYQPVKRVIAILGL